MTSPLPLITYSVSASGVITELSELTWSRFASENCGEQILSPAAVLGRTIFDFIAGQEVVASYKAIHEVLLQGLLPEISIVCHCDAPNRRRVQQIKIALGARAPEPSLRYTCRILEETPLEPVPLLHGPGVGVAGAATVTMCTYCMDIHLPPDATNGVWLSMDAYAAQSGPAQAVISHGICPSCKVRVVDPMLARLRERRTEVG